MSYQPRYVAYARAHGMTPDAVLERDRCASPGGHMVPYILWIGSMWQEWYGVIGYQPKAKTEAVHAQFDEWLGRRMEGGGDE